MRVSRALYFFFELLLFLFVLKRISCDIVKQLWDSMLFSSFFRLGPLRIIDTKSFRL